jgi:hypothetical protein
MLFNRCVEAASRTVQSTPSSEEVGEQFMPVDGLRRCTEQLYGNTCCNASFRICEINTYISLSEMFILPGQGHLSAPRSAEDRESSTVFV